MEVHTSRLAAKWRGGELVFLRNVITGETYAANGGGSNGVFSTVRTLGGVGDLRSVGGWQSSDGVARLTARSDKASYVLRVSVDP